MQTESRMICGINTIRGICAIWVLLSHFGPPLTAGIDKSSYLNIVIRGVVHNMINGPAAVIVFFVISGLCIHLPHVRTLKISSIPQFYVKRLVRIMLPLVVAIAIAASVGVGGLEFENSVLWSLVCEVIYYILYPIFLIARRRFGSWKLICLAGFIGAFCVALSNPQAKFYPSFGWKYNWLLGLPCWIVGCFVAELICHADAKSMTFVIMIRCLVWLVSGFLSVLWYHSPIGYPWSLNFFAFLAGYWIFIEIGWCDKHGSIDFFEWLGKWSYSVYLMHIPAHHFLIKIIHLPLFSGMADWILLTSILLLICYVFYLLIEIPSHWLARTLAKFC